jgi:subtilisin-like proprotein convertase family protein
VRRYLVPFFVAAGIVASLAGAATFSNSDVITINDPSNDPPDVAKASPYPSSVSVSGLTGVVNKVTVSVFGLTHQFPDDVDMVLVAPSGTAVLLMSDAGDGYTVIPNKQLRPSRNQAAVSGVNLTFDDAASNFLPDDEQIVSGTYKPSNYGPVCSNEAHPDTFPAPGPGTGPFPTTLSTFNGLSPNGTWNLYVVDDCRFEGGSIGGGWSLNVTAGVPTAVGVERLASQAGNRGVTVRWQTASEATILGFNVYRSTTGGAAHRLNSQLIAARHAGVGNGASYAFADRTVRPGVAYTYRLQVVDRTGTRQWFGSTSIRAS